MDTYQGALTVVTPVRRGRAARLEALLDRIGGDLENNGLIRFYDLERVHFMRWLLVPETHDLRGEPIGPSLVLSTNFDLPLDRHLDELVRVGRPALDAIYEHCVGYPSEPGRNSRRIQRYLRVHTRSFEALHIGSPHRSVQQVLDENRLRDAIEAFVDARAGQPDWPPDGALAVRAAIREFVASRDDLRWALEPPPAPGAGWKLRHYASAVAKFAWRGLPRGLLLLATFPVLLWLERRDERAAWAGLGEPGAAAAWRLKTVSQHARLAALEDDYIQNQLSAPTVIKPGFVRFNAVRFVLSLLELLARIVYTKGKLGEIPAIHFARWVVMDDKRRLLFMSNYDGSWESYLGSFIDHGAWGLTGIWSNTPGFPHTEALFFKGARNEPRFKEWARAVQVRTQVWHRRYPHLTVDNVNNSSKIRAGLSGRMDEDEARAWLRHL